MFESVSVVDPVNGDPPGWTARDEDALDWKRIERELRYGEEERSWGNTCPSGLLALEIDTDTQHEDALSDAQLIDAMVGYERLAAWAQAGQARVLAEFARRRPGDDQTMVATDKPCAMSTFAPDEVGLALTLSRMTAKARLGRAVQLQQVLPETLRLWQQGRLDERRVGAICDATHYLTSEKARAVQQRVLDKAPGQTLAGLKAALRRAVIHVDPEGAAERHKSARRDRRVGIREESDGMATLWALLSAQDAEAGFQWLTRLARGLGKVDARGMDARRADLAAALLSGRLTNAAPDPAAGAAADSDTAAGTDGTGSVDAADGEECASSVADAAGDTATEAETGTQPAGDTGSALNVDIGTADSGEADTAGAGAHAPPDGGGGGGWSSPRPVNPGKPLVQVLMPFTTLLGADDQPCELVGHGAITAEQAREIAADATLRRLVYDPLSGTVLDYGRTTYRPPAGLADFVRARDVYCRSPICRRRALDGHLDHIEPYPHGPTNDKNLHGCCGHEHRMKHAPGWAVRALPDGRIQWITPTGHRYHSDPYDYRAGDDLPPDKSTQRDLPKDLVARLERIERDRCAAARWDGEAGPPDDENEPPPF